MESPDSYYRDDYKAIDSMVVTEDFGKTNVQPTRDLSSDFHRPIAMDSRGMLK
jgi:hypothetical protein